SGGAFAGGVSGRVARFHDRAGVGRAAAHRLSDEGADGSGVLSQARADRRGAVAGAVDPPPPVRGGRRERAPAPEPQDAPLRRRGGRAVGGRRAHRAPARVYLQLPHRRRAAARSLIMVESSIEWLESTALANLVFTYGWLWPISEALHFMGLVLLAGSAGLLGLRRLGLGKGIPPAAVHRLVPFGLLGFVAAVLTGVVFV